MFKFSLLIAAITLVIIDNIYLNLVKGYFFNQIQKVQNSPVKMNYTAILICYLFLIVGLNYFIIQPNKTPSDAFLLGIVIYGVYETTNLALFSNWSWLTSIMDTLWGGLLFAVTTFIVRALKRL